MGPSDAVADMLEVSSFFADKKKSCGMFRF